MCLVLDVMCSKSNKAKLSSKSSGDGSGNGNNKTYKKCYECRTRRITRDEVYNMFSPAMSSPYVPPAVNMSRTQLRYDTSYDYGHGYASGYGYGYGYDTSVWDELYPAVISKGQWKDHTQTVKNTYNLLEENGKLIGEVKSAVTSEIKEARDAIRKAHESVSNTNDHVQDTLAAIKRTQDMIGESHAAQTSKQQECTADIARVRQLLEAEAKQREETRRVQEMVQYAQTQGLLQQGDRDSGSGHSSLSSSSRITSASPTRSPPPSSQRQRWRAAEYKEKEDEDEDETERRRQWEREMERFEQYQQAQQARFAEAMRKFADKQQRMQEEHERWWRRRQQEQQVDEGGEQYAGLRRRREHHRSRHTPLRPQTQTQTQTLYCEDDVIEMPPYNAYSYAEYGIGGSTAKVRDRGSRVHYARQT